MRISLLIANFISTNDKNKKTILNEYPKLASSSRAMIGLTENLCNDIDNWRKHDKNQKILLRTIIAEGLRLKGSVER